MTFRPIQQRTQGCWVGLIAFMVLTPWMLLAATKSKKMPIAAEWGCYEKTFRSRVAYANPLQDASLTVVFKSPLKETYKVSGFWDGGRTWRVRFSPNLLGHWTYTATCSNPSDKGLQNQSGEFLCTPPIGASRFNLHGPVRVARNGRYFEQADHTPFFWLADTTWNGAQVSDNRDWEFYAHVRELQGFSAVQWAAVSENDTNQAAFTGYTKIAVNPEYFQELDSRIVTLNRANLLSVIAPFLEIADSASKLLPEDQAALLIRYMEARWGAYQVAWLIMSDQDDTIPGATRWRHIGRAAFGAESHAPVIKYLSSLRWDPKEFRHEAWVDAFGYQSGPDVDESSLMWLLAGPPSIESKFKPTRPLINVAPPYENAPRILSYQHVSPSDVRAVAYWSLLRTPVTGVSYGAQGVVNWDENVGWTGTNSPGSRLPFWHVCLFLPAAKDMATLADFFTSIDFWRLRPISRLVFPNSNDLSPDHVIALADTADGNLLLAYVAKARKLVLPINALPPAPNMTWLNPRSGAKSTAVAVLSGDTCQIPTPGPGDWLLEVKSGN